MGVFFFLFYAVFVLVFVFLVFVSQCSSYIGSVYTANHVSHVDVSDDINRKTEMLVPRTLDVAKFFFSNVFWCD